MRSVPPLTARRTPTNPPAPTKLVPLMPTHEAVLPVKGGRLRLFLAPKPDWAWPTRPADESPTEPNPAREPIRGAVRHFLAGGPDYRLEDR